MIAAVLLAAGESRRMGQPKALLLWAGVPLIQYQVQALVDGGVDEVIAVLGHDADRLRAVLTGLPVRIAVNDAYRTGKCSSIRRGVNAVSADVDALLLIGVDQPRPPWLIRRLIDEHRANGAAITVPVHGGHRGHPIVIAASLRAEILTIAEETQGLRAVLDRHTSSTHGIPFETDLVHLDMNTPAAYEEGVRGPRPPSRDIVRVEAMLGPLPEPSAQPVLVVLVGLPGSGKSTVATALAERLSVVIIRSDAVRKLLFPKPTYSGVESGRVFRAIHNVLQNLLNRGISAVLDATSLTESERRPLRRIAAKTNARILFVHIVTPPGIVRQRFEQRIARPAPGELSDATWEIYEEFRRRYEPIQGPHIEVSGAAAPAANAETIVAALQMLS